MVWLWDKIHQICRCLYNASSMAVTEAAPTSRKAKRPRSRVRFSPSTVRRHLTQRIERLSSTDPFFNFLLVYSVHMNRLDLENDTFSFHDIGQCTYTARGLWFRMKAEQRAPYMAIAQRVQQRNAHAFQTKRALDHSDNRIRMEAFQKLFQYEQLQSELRPLQSADKPAADLLNLSKFK